MATLQDQEPPRLDLEREESKWLLCLCDLALLILHILIGICSDYDPEASRRERYARRDEPSRSDGDSNWGRGGGGGGGGGGGLIVEGGDRGGDRYGDRGGDRGGSRYGDRGGGFGDRGGGIVTAIVVVGTVTAIVVVGTDTATVVVVTDTATVVVDSTAGVAATISSAARAKKGLPL